MYHIRLFASITDEPWIGNYFLSAWPRISPTWCACVRACVPVWFCWTFSTMHKTTYSFIFFADLLKAMLTFHPNERTSAAAALLHPFFTEEKVIVSIPIAATPSWKFNRHQIFLLFVIDFFQRRWSGCGSLSHATFSWHWTHGGRCSSSLGKHHGWSELLSLKNLVIKISPVLAVMWM